MHTVTCYQCPVCLDVTSRAIAEAEAERHATLFRHDVGVYRLAGNRGSLALGPAIALILKSRLRAA